MNPLWYRNKAMSWSPLRVSFSYFVQFRIVRHSTQFSSSAISTLQGDLKRKNILSNTQPHTAKQISKKSLDNNIETNS